jgi:hypothetical protein
LYHHKTLDNFARRYRISGVRIKQGEGIFTSKKMIGLALVMAVAFSIAFMVGCTTTTSKATGGREYFPNEDGYGWRYSMSVTIPPTILTGTSEATFVGTYPVDSILVAQVLVTDTIVDSSHEIELNLVQVTDAAVLTYGTVGDSTTEATKILDFPLEVGKKWVTIGTFESEVVARETVSVPLGDYDDCFKIYNSLDEVYWWLAPNVGPIKYVDVDPTEVTTMELVYKNF